MHTREQLRDALRNGRRLGRMQELVILEEKICLEAAHMLSMDASKITQEPVVEPAVVKKLEEAQKFIAWVADTVEEDIYKDRMNRMGLAEDCKAYTTGEMNVRWLDAKWQADRAAKAEKQFQDLIEQLGKFKTLIRNTSISHPGMQTVVLALHTEVDRIIDESVR